MDEDFLDSKLKTDLSSFQNQPYDYDLIKLQKALEFADLVFDNVEIEIKGNAKTKGTI